MDVETVIPFDVRVSVHQDSDGFRRLRISGALGVAGVAALKGVIAGELGTCRRLVLDLSEVTDCDTAGLQLIYGLCRQPVTLGTEICLGPASASLHALAARLGVGFSPRSQENL